MNSEWWDQPGGHPARGDAREGVSHGGSSSQQDLMKGSARREGGKGQSSQMMGGILTVVSFDGWATPGGT